MINLEDYMKAINYRISEGTEYLWKCFGDNPFTLSYWDNDHDGVSADITFDTQTQEVYYATVHDYAKRRSYRLINPDYVEAYRQECKDKNVVENNAYDEVNYVTLETDEDFIEKLTAIVNKQPYNTKVQVPLELDKEELYTLMTLAHERDITLNQLVENMLWEAINNHETKV